MREFVGTSYFGLQHDPSYLDLVREGMGLFGLNNPISRMANADFSELLKAESVVAKELNCEAACLFSSGYLAGTARASAHFG